LVVRGSLDNLCVMCSHSDFTIFFLKNRPQSLLASECYHVRSQALDPSTTMTDSNTLKKIVSTLEAPAPLPVFCKPIYDTRLSMLTYSL